jgi:hypothetical protein
MRLALVAVLGSFLFAAATSAQDLPTTHDHGITITPDHLTSAIQETQDFWGPVRKHLLSTDCKLGDPSPRAEAVAFLKTVHDGLHHRLFERTEADALDLITFLGHRLRSFEVYRRLRHAVNDDATTLAVFETQQRELRDINLLPAAERPARISALNDQLVTLVQSRGIADEKLVQAKQIIGLQLKIADQIAATDAGKMLAEFEGKAKNLDPAVGLVLLEISTAADWVLIVRAEGSQIGRADFLQACLTLAELRTKLTAAAAAATIR